MPAVNLVHGDRFSSVDYRFPASLLLSLPNELRYGSYDLDHGDLMVFGPDTTWSDIVANPKPVVKTVAGEPPTITIEYLRPWPLYPFVSVPGE